MHVKNSKAAGTTYYIWELFQNDFSTELTSQNLAYYALKSLLKVAWDVQDHNIAATQLTKCSYSAQRAARVTGFSNTTLHNKKKYEFNVESEKKLNSTHF